MTVTTRVRHLIEVTTDRGRLAFEFNSRDIGHTQGTTLTYSDLNPHSGPTVLAQYRPGTRHWATALDIAEQVLAEAVTRATANNKPWSIVQLCRELETVLAEEQYRPWDGTDPNEGDDW